MDRKDIKFLTKSEAINEICDDFKYHPEQYDLIAKVYSFLTNNKAWIGEKKCPPFGINYEGIWIQTKNSEDNIFHTFHDFDDLLIKSFADNPIDNERLCKLYIMVLEVNAYTGKNPEKDIDGIYVETEMEKFKCKQCGRCCLSLIDAYCTNADNEDLKRWEKENRYDILSHIQTGELWFNPKTGEELGRCPWLIKLPKQDRYICKIYETKPSHCRAYPKYKKQALQNGCKGFSD